MKLLMVRSLQGRMLLALGVTIALCWAVALSMLMIYLSHSQSSIWDSKLQAIATKIMSVIPSKREAMAAKKGKVAQLQLPESIPDSEHLAFQIWIYDADATSGELWPVIDGRRIRNMVRTSGAPGAPLKPDLEDGFASLTIEGQRWRVYSVSDTSGQVFVQVANLHSVIDAELQRAALIALVINTVLVALVGALMWCAVRRSLKPVMAIETALRERETFDLTPLPDFRLPTELHPLVESFNHLLVQLDEAVQGERRFIGDAAHELRTPLSALQAQAQVALGAQTMEAKDTALIKLLAVAERSTRLSEQLLDLARLNAGVHAAHRTMADLSELILHVAHEFEIYAHQHGRTILLATEPAHIACDIDEIGILLRNLVDNALRYTTRGGRVRISCGYGTGETGEHVYLEVADDGPGVPESEHEAIFRRFHRVAGNGGRGSGIGLSLVSGIAALHRATLKTGTGLDGRGFSICARFPTPANDAGQQRREDKT